MTVGKKVQSWWIWGGNWQKKMVSANESGWMAKLAKTAEGSQNALWQSQVQLGLWGGDLVPKLSRGISFPCPGDFFSWPVLFSVPYIYPATSVPCCMLFAAFWSQFPTMLHAICSILELELFILYVICNIWGLEPSMLNAICSILELELSI